MGCHAGDVASLLEICVWIRQIGGCQGHQAVIVADAATPAGSILAVKNEASNSFNSVQIVSTDTSVSGWPKGPNSIFLRAAQFAQSQGQPWLFLETDAIPLCPGWLDK